MHRSFNIVVLLFVISAGAIVAAASVPARHASLPSPQRAVDPCAKLPSRWQRVQCFEYHRSAPGDEYFGRMKMSYLGIDNTAHDVAIEAGAYTTDPGLISKIDFADEALRQWEQRYPGDPQLARSYFLMFEALRKIYTIDEQHRAWSYMQHILSAYRATYFGKLVRGDLARGFTEHWFAVAQVCPTPLPTEPPGYRGRWTPPTPEPTVEPVPTESPTPTPPGQPSVVVMVPPCVPAATPTPLPTEMPEEMPTETPSTEPSPIPLPT